METVKKSTDLGNQKLQKICAQFAALAECEKESVLKIAKALLFAVRKGKK
ncbi:MAG: hypothetical protein LBT84_07595 [Spirochaetia bacterium]|jgi:hypothetical protein|nr:hypothetical protein [Spirochaetia bacterium]